jgi:hypothetical protein
MILCNKLLLDRATSQLASCSEPSRVSSLFSRATKTDLARARSECRAGPNRAELLRARASSSSLIFFSSPMCMFKLQLSLHRISGSLDLVTAKHAHIHAFCFALAAVCARGRATCYYWRQLTPTKLVNIYTNVLLTNVFR